VSWRCADPAGRPLPGLELCLTIWERREELVRTATVTVERVTGPGGEFALKRYRFPFLRRRIEAAFRHSWIAVPKARRELRSLARMQALGIPVVEPYGCGWRRDALGFVVDSFLLSRWWPHPDLARSAAAGEPLPPAAWQALGRAAGALHARGVAHGGLAARNLLIGREERGVWQARILDPARARFGGAPLGRARAEADLLPLQPALLAAGAEARAAFADGYCSPSLPSSAASAGSTSCASPTMP